MGLLTLCEAQGVEHSSHCTAAIQLRTLVDVEVWFGCSVNLPTPRLFELTAIPEQLSEHGHSFKV